MKLVWPGPDDLGFFIRKDTETVQIEIGDGVIVVFKVLNTCTVDKVYVHNDGIKTEHGRNMTFRLTYQIIHAIYIRALYINKSGGISYE